MMSAEKKRKVYGSSSSFNYLSHHDGNGIEKSLKKEIWDFSWCCINHCWSSFTLWLTCEQALRATLAAGRGKERELATTVRLWNLNIYIEKVDAKCWLAKMTLVMTSLPLARVSQCLSTVAIVSASRWLGENWQLTRQEATGKLEVEFKFQRHSCELSFLFPPRCQRAPESLLASYAVVWVLFIVFSIFSVESFGDCTRQQH